MSVWRAFNSLLVLRDQVNVIAPDRSKGADGLVGDEDHQGTTSDHNPHPVQGVGPAMVSALDLTHDPANGFDSYTFADILLKWRDKRIKYVISNKRIFSSYTSGSRHAWTWGAYSGTDPHTNHVHISVLDNAASDSRDLWNLEGFDMSIADVRTGVTQLTDEGANRSTPTGRSYADDFNVMISAAVTDEFKAVNDKLDALNSKLDQILALLVQGGGGSFPSMSNFTATQAVTGTITWITPE